MSLGRRAFFHRTLFVGPLSMAFWIETDAASAQDAECTLPNPGNATPFVPNEPKILTRYSASEMAEPARFAQLKAFRDAVGLVRNLQPSDVIGWSKHVAQHCIRCAPSNTSNIHFDWMFLPWHRGLLYFLERVMRKLSKNDDLRMVYWDWEASQSRRLPSIYGPAGQPLYWRSRQLTGPTWPLQDDDVDVQGLLSLPFRLFGGTAIQGSPVPATFSGAHANVHNAFDPGDMADLQYSPRDPVFYAHHGNIDRLWSSWVAAGHSSPDFGAAKVYFYDENRTWRSTLLNDLRDETKLGYQYSSLMRARVPVARLQMLPLPKAGNRVTLAGLAMDRANNDGPQYLVIENIQELERLPRNTVRYGIFVGSPEKGVSAASTAGYLGKASRVLSKGHEHVEPLSAVLNVSRKLRPLAERNRGVLDFTVAPLDTQGKTTATAVPLAAASVSLIS